MTPKQKKAIELLHRNDIVMQDILSVLYDLRSCIRYSLTLEQRVLLRKALPCLGLRIVDYIYSSTDQPMCVIGKHRPTLKKASEADKIPDLEKVGHYLGYPSCCIDFWLRNKWEHSDTIPLLTKKNSKQLHYKLNYLLNFDSKAVTDSLPRLHQLFGKYRDFDKYLIPHIPCSFDCQPSLQYANSLAEIMKDEFPDYFQTLKSRLKKTFLFIDNYTFTAVEGETKGDEVIYSQVFDFNTLFDDNLFKLLIHGNRIRWEQEKTVVFKDSIQIGESELPLKIFEFK